MKKRGFIILVCLVMLVLCGSVAHAQNVEDSLLLGIVSTKTLTIRPLIPVERDIISLYNVVYESLVTIDDDGLPQPLLAQSWVDSNGGSTWTFTLRDDVYFSDGTPLTANDVVATCNYILNLANAENVADNGFYQNIKYLISDISAPDDYTVIVTASRSYYGLLYAMTFPILHASQVDVDNPLGTGPYMIYEFVPTQYMWLKANPNWWQLQPQVQEIMTSFYPNNSDLITAYEYGQVDTAFTRSIAAAQYKSGINSLSIPYTTRQLEVLLMYHGEYSLAMDKVRQAIRYAIDVDAISSAVYMDMTVDADTPIAIDSWLYYDQESTFAYNPEYAKQLLEEAGWSDSDNDGTLDRVEDGGVKNLMLRIYVYEDPDNDVRYETASMIVDMLAEVKINARIEYMSYGDALEKLEAGSYDMVLGAFQMDVVPDAGFCLTTNNTHNYMRYKSTEMTALFNTLRTNESQEDFLYTWYAIQQQFANDVPFICLFYRSGSVLTRKMYTTVRTLREYELLRGIESFGR